MNIDIQTLEKFFDNNILKEEYSYLSFINTLKNDSNLNLENILNQLFILSLKNENTIILDSIYACTMSEDFSSINFTKFFDKYKMHFLYVFNEIFARQPDSYFYFPLKKFTYNILAYLSIATSMLKNNTDSARYICNQDLNKIFITHEIDSEITQNQILDLKLTCSIFK